MKTNNLPEYPRITLADLSRLTLDDDSARRFERRFYPGLLGGVGLAFGGFAAGILLHYFNLVSDTVLTLVLVGSFVFGLAIALWTHHCMMRSPPRSARTGEEMKPFIIQDVEAPDHYELAYVDEGAGTYFKRIYVERGG